MTGGPPAGWPRCSPTTTAIGLADTHLRLGYDAAGLRGRNWEQEQERIEQEGAMSDNIGNRLLAAFERGQ